MEERNGLEVIAVADADRTSSRPAAQEPDPSATESLNPSGLEVLTIEDVATYLRLPVSTAYRLAKKKELPGSKVGRHWRFHRKTLEDWFRGRIAQGDRTRGEAGHIQEDAS